MDHLKWQNTIQQPYFDDDVLLASKSTTPSEDLYSTTGSLHTRLLYGHPLGRLKPDELVKVAPNGPQHSVMAKRFTRSITKPTRLFVELNGDFLLSLNAASIERLPEGHSWSQKSKIQVTKLINNQSSTGIEDHASKKSSKFLSLPGEIRNMILDYALISGHIYFSKKTQPVDWSGAPLSISGCQLLATCKQLYFEGYTRFYSRNSFHLAPGPADTSSKYLNNLIPQHQNLINSITIHLSLADLTPHVLETINQAFFLNTAGKSIAEAGNREIVHYVCKALLAVWTDKIAAVRKIKSVQVIRIECMYLCTGTPYQHTRATYELKGPGLENLLKRVNPESYQRWKDGFTSCYAGWDDHIYTLIEWTNRLASRAILELLDRLTSQGYGGWNGFGQFLSHHDIVNREPLPTSWTMFWSEEHGWRPHPYNKVGLKLRNAPEAAE